MSKLEKFERSDSWRKLLQTHILSKREPQSFEMEIAPSRSGYECNIPNKENIPTAVSDEVPDIPAVSDESFAIMEKMCDKTASDPNSTLFNYLHSDHQDEIMRVAKYKFDDNLNTIADAGFLARTDNIKIKTSVQCDDFNVTNIADIEAPSKLWDKTITDVTSGCQYSAENQEISTSFETAKDFSLGSIDHYLPSDELSGAEKQDTVVCKPHDAHNDPKFNDTIEEVNFMLEQFATSSSKTKQNLLETSPKVKTQAKSHFTPKEPPTCSSTTLLKCPNSVGKKSPTYLAKNCNINVQKSEMLKYQYGRDICSPKNVQFKKPNQTSNKKVHYRDEMSVKNQFSHIVSPIGAYIKSTATTPLMDNIKAKEKRVLNGKAFRQLDYLHHATNTKSAIISPAKPDSSNILPKKAYITSDIKHVIDQRNQIIPGGKKVHKLIEPSLSSVVVRHEGKIKMGNINQHGGSIIKSSNIPRRTNSSLANLSVATGDVSLHTVMNARKF